jgi:hypothetical protein
MGKSTAKTAFVINLSVFWNAQFAPKFQQEVGGLWRNPFLLQPGSDPPKAGKRNQ